MSNREDRLCSCGGKWRYVKGDPTVSGDTEYRHEPAIRDTSGHMVLDLLRIFEPRDGDSASDV